MPPLRRSENSSDSSLPDFALVASESESEGEDLAAASLEAALRRLTPRMPPLRRAASSASDSSLPDLASASSSASEAESEGSFNLPRLARGQRAPPRSGRASTTGAARAASRSRGRPGRRVKSCTP